MRGLFALLAIVAVVVAVGFFADHPGRVEIVWQDWQIDTSVGVLLATTLALALVAWGLVSTATALFRLPWTIRRRLRERRRRLGERAVTGGLIAVAAGDGVAADRAAQRAGRFLPETPLALLLAAQAAELNCDTAAAQRLYQMMLDRPALWIVGLRGLLGQAVADGDHDRARSLAERARELGPKTRGLSDSLLALEARTGHWEAAAATLAAARRRGLVAADRAQHQRGAILHELSRAAETAGDLRRATRLAGKAQGLAPDLAPLTAHHARLLLALGRKRAAARALERGWRVAPHPELARAYAAMHAADTALARVSASERLAAQNPGALESHIAIAEAALAAQLWGEARRHLGNAVAQILPAETPRRLCLLMARLEDSEHGGRSGGDSGEARLWLDRAATAPPDPCYGCGQCGGESAEWHTLCPRCGGFDTLAWRAANPMVTAAVEVLPRTPALPAAGR